MTLRIQVSTVMATMDRPEKTNRRERIIARAEKRIELLKAGSEMPVEKTAPQGHYSQQYVRCGKVSCKGAHGELHGPYWYHIMSLVADATIRLASGRTVPTPSRILVE